MSLTGNVPWRSFARPAAHVGAGLGVIDTAAAWPTWRMLPVGALTVAAVAWRVRHVD